MDIKEKALYKDGMFNGAPFGLTAGAGESSVPGIEEMKKKFCGRERCVVESL